VPLNIVELYLQKSNYAFTLKPPN